MSLAPASIFEGTATQPRVALVAALPTTVEYLRAAVVRAGLRPVVVAGGVDAIAASHGGKAVLAIVDVDFNGRGAGTRAAAQLRRLTGASVVMVGSDPEVTAEAALAVDGLALYRQAPDAQTGATLRLALGRHHAPRTSDPPPARESHAAALRQIAAIVDSLSREARGVPTGNVAVADLRPREQQIVRLLLAHHRVPAIASVIGISAHTVRNHLKNIYRRIGVHSQQELLDALRH